MGLGPMLAASLKRGRGCCSPCKYKTSLHFLHTSGSVVRTMLFHGDRTSCKIVLRTSSGNDVMPFTPLFISLKSVCLRLSSPTPDIF